ncbi:hypothetical protein [Brumimicrobium aurantiacum]|uniref:Uncharacterized protein n=1 Tax=Brumimicrobium aurantiacum TaxID=1737063 RepID=A0A3E1EUM0_9FLAO|nr:hypothetical protein [Brumimicrobium aurantiacum]RFC53245.1 hypothetical protein DXU93_14365 [Brumimicrobium aurantiacum]
MSTISLGGTDWLGIGSAVSGSSVEGCGTRPLFDSDGKAAYDECVANQQKIKAAELASGSTTSQNNTKYIMIGLVLIAIIIAVIFISIKKNKK